MSAHVHKCALHECPELVECQNDPCLEDVSIPTPECCPEHQPMFEACVAALRGKK